MNGEPLAYRMRPTNLDEVVGQKDIIGKTTSLYKMIKNGHVPSMLLYGEPGIGKTSIAFAIAGTTKLPFIALNATTSGKKDVEAVVDEARLTGKVILFLDEIHRFNKAQQDYLLPHVERGDIVLIGATTENPYHDVNPAIRSRCGQIKQLKRLTDDDIEELLHRALQDEKGLANLSIQISKEQIAKIAKGTNGDARKSLTLLESIVYSSDKEDDVFIIKDDTIDQMIEKVGVFGDKKGSHFYNLLSSLQKSIRGSDVDAALYYLAHLLETGDLVAVNRRLLVIAYEDVGLANTSVGNNVLAAVTASERLGLPEARIPLSVAVVEMCLSSKSNAAYKALDAAIADVRNGRVGDIPMHLRDGHYEGSKKLGHVGYIYPHDYPIGTFGGWVDQEYFPEKLKGTQYYHPTEAGEEKKLGAIYDKLKGFKKNK
ncbi:replication-associated recombination protein A [Niallia circulans]|jgi:putative ATPase|uniref:replication-associated recombination protein A n=1 Tax=Niallia TaxID=2837506 RepID=UPI00077C7BF3|nr:replication-associated recombination protein A [Niallia circulans]MCM2980628.1 replication-associated recombination protein A [Niallia circulans]MDR4317802.1 replication-associated recombination protein A [Niallia circulans]MED3841587.1 replication-associated recombination protein A [Niallia circulans]MED4243323.1 replication-associated recombination protein A [Niallia circulans]MED4248372.1 replication-associated recombination protein A [Niallia circulans]